MLKNTRIKSFDKKKEIEKVLNSLSDSDFNDLVSIGNEITDYNQFEDDNSVLSNAIDIDDDMGVAVEFQEDEDDEEGVSDLDMVHEDDDEDDDDDDVDNGVAEPATLEVGGGIDDDDNDDMKEANNGSMSLIDAYWLQRKISQAYNDQEQVLDPQQCQRLAEKVIGILANIGDDDREVENKLLKELQFDKFSLIKFLLLNRQSIAWCTLLARAQNQKEKN